MTARRRRYSTQVLCTVLATLLFWAPAAQVAYAQDPEGEYTYSGVEAEVREEYRDALRNEQIPESLRHELDVRELRAVDQGSPETPAGDPTATPISLPGGQQASAVTPQAISLPNAEGSVEGMGESFSPVLSSGTASFSVPIAVAPGRAGVQPSLALSYSTTGGNGPVGFGWGIGAPFISRQTDRGLPQYIDGPAWHPREDRFIYNGGQELVPVDTAAIGIVDGQANGGTPPAVPSELASWQQYRARVEGAFMRFFRSPDSMRWVVQSKDGTRFDFGALPSGHGPAEAVSNSLAALERDPERTIGGVYRWTLTRMSDPHGSTVYYLYDQREGHSYLRDIYYVSPNSCAASTPDVTRQCTTSLSSYAARVRLVYEPRHDVFTSYVAGWRIETARRLERVEVTAYNDSVGARTLVRRYHLTYASDSFHSLLEQVRVEGRPSAAHEDFDGVQVGDATIPESALTDAIVGELLPPMRFTYTRMPEGGVPGFGTIDARVHPVASSPPHSVDEGRSDLFDVNSDGLPDLIVTDPSRYRTATGEPAVGVFFNGFRGSEAAPAGAAAHFSDAVPMGMSNPASASAMNLSNLNVVPMDIDGDGRSDLLHMPRLRRYGWWAPTRRAGPDVPEVSPARQGWEWTYAEVDLPPEDTDPRIDLGRDSQHIRIMDVNNDHLIDVVRTTGTVMQTWINLGFLPGGDGRFGSYQWTGSEHALSTEPFESCLLHAGLPIDFEDPEVRIADLNGDGLQDIAKIRRGRIIYWPGRGEGVWGEGSRDCARGEGAGRYIEMATPPPELAIDLDGVFLQDVNMDGAADIVQVRFRNVDVYFNRAGHGWTPRTTVSGTPATPAFAPRIRFADIDGSSTTDIVWGNAHAWEYIDPAGGVRPRLLVGVENGLGAQTTIEYGSSADDYTSDLAAAASCGASCPDRFTWSQPATGPDLRLCALSHQVPLDVCNTAAESEAERSRWMVRASGSPVIGTVVRSIRTTDGFDVFGGDAQVTESRFAYHDAYYEGIEQEFRGFGAADAIAVGDWNNPTAYSRTHFLQGRRPSEIASDRLEDNPNEALKGREVMSEVFDEAGTFLSTSWAAITNRHLHTGLDGRMIHYAFVFESNQLRYDTSPFTADGATMFRHVVHEEVVDPTNGQVLGMNDEVRPITIRGTGAVRIRTTFEEVDNLGHVHMQIAHGQVGVTNASGIDGPIVRHIEPTLVNAQAWMWRTHRTYLTGHDLSGAASDTTNTYDAQTGEILSATQVVTSGLAYTFGDETEAEGDARGFSQNDDDLVASRVYDAWGNPVASCAGAVIASASFTTGCLRYGAVTYDDTYRQLATKEHLQVGLGSTLTYEGTWDRGLGAILSSEDPNGLVSEVTYDGLGRLTALSPPAVDGCPGAGDPLTPRHPTTTIRYELTAAPRSQPISRVITTTALDCVANGQTLESIGYVDGLGRPRASLSTGEDPGVWVRSGITTLDKKGTVRRAYQTDLYDGGDTAYASVVAPAAGIPYATARYDAFGRAKGVHAEDNSVTWVSYHALAMDVCDPLDNDPSSEHYRTCTSAGTDGHGRVIDQQLRNRNPDTGAAEMYRLWAYYRADGAVTALVRAESTGPRPSSYTGTLPEPHVLRTFAYDSAGRRLSSDDPDTDDLTNGSQASNSWRYLFNRVGDLVAVRDPRGCGQNFFYDFGGRLVGEQYVSCAEAQTAASEQPHTDNTVANLISDTFSPGVVSLDVLYHYDSYPQWAIELEDDDELPSTASGVLGRATGVSDRAQRAVLAYDDRGNVTWTARQMALISEETTLPGTVALDSTGRPSEDALEAAPYVTDVVYDETNTYIRRATFDHAGRAQSMTLPRDPDYDGTAPLVIGTLTYNARGLPASATAAIGSETQTIVAAIEYLRDGLVGSLTYGDGDGRDPTVSTTTYDVRRRPIRFTTVREATGATGTLAPIETVVDQQLVWDAANNLVAQIDHRDASEWPAGHRPQTVHMRHDALYRVIGAEYDYTQLDGRRTPVDDATDWRDNFGLTRAHDPMRQSPAAMASAQPDDRVASLTWSWDYLANATETTDDANSFYERSLGAIANGDDLSSTLRPSALYLASNIGDGSTLDGGSGWVEVDYGVGGNVTAMTVHSQCADAVGETCDDPGGSLASRRSALRSGCACAVEQHYVYRWDELNRMAEARRYDREAGSWVRKVRQRYRYDASNQRTVKQTLDEEEGTDPPVAGFIPRERTALYVYPGDFERRGLVRGFYGYEANDDLGTETQYVIAGARTVWKHDPSGGGAYDREARFTVGLADLIQTTAAVLDVRTGELLETSTYYPNGARETFLVDSETATAPEVAGFTGKEGDEEVGVVYFGERYLIPRLGRWASPDPLHVHAGGGGEVLNSYHYVSGNLLAARDPLGLEWSEWSQPFDAGGGRMMQDRWSDNPAVDGADYQAEEVPFEALPRLMQDEIEGAAIADGREAVRREVARDNFRDESLMEALGGLGRPGIPHPDGPTGLTLRARLERLIGDSGPNSAEAELRRRGLRIADGAWGEGVEPIPVTNARWGNNSAYRTFRVAAENQAREEIRNAAMTGAAAADRGLPAQRAALRPRAAPNRPAPTQSGPTVCFVAGTLVDTPEGPALIQDIEAGDQVYAFDDGTGELVISTVVQTFVSQAEVIIDLTIRYADGGRQATLSGTPEHLFYVPTIMGYVPMAALQPGTTLATSAPGAAVVVSLAVREGDFEVFNFEVERVHNYYAGAPGYEGPGILVHNDCFDLVREVNGLPRSARLTTDVDDVFRRLADANGIDPRLASQRLHSIKSAAGRGGADNVILDLTGNVFSPETGELLGSLTQGGARAMR